MHLEQALSDVASGLSLRMIVGARPRQVVLRRAASTAYHAVSRSFRRLRADELVGVTAPTADRIAIDRSVEHRSIKSLRTNRQFGPSVRNIVATAIDLRDQRNLADYDPRPQEFGGRARVRSLVGSAEGAVIAIAALSPADRKTLAVALIAKTRK